MMPGTQQVIDQSKIGKKGYPRHYEALGLAPPMKAVPIIDDVPQNEHPGLDPIEVYRLEIQARIDATARERQYDSGATLAGYVNSTVPQWAAEATAFVAWRDDVWAYALVELDKVTSGTREQPTVDEFLAELPVFEWPAAA